MVRCRYLSAYLLVTVLFFAITCSAHAFDDVTGPILVSAVGETDQVTVGNIYTDISAIQQPDYEGPILNTVSAMEGGKATLTAEGSVESTGISATSNGEGSIASVTVNGNVSNTLNDIFNDYGIVADSANGGQSNVIVSGDVSVSGSLATGINGYARDETSKSTVSVEGNVNVVSVADSMLGGERSTAVQLTWNNGVTDLIVNGDAEASGTGNVQGVAIWSNTKDADVTIGGDVSAISSDPEANAVGILVTTRGGETSVSVAGDVYSSKTGLEVDMERDVETSIDILIEGSLASEETPVLLSGNGLENALTLTVWKVELDTEQDIVTVRNYDPFAMMPADPSPEDEELAKQRAENIEANILYIVKLDQPESGGSVSLDGVADSHGFSVAKESEIVTLKATTDSEYKVIGAYNNGIALAQNDDGNYFIAIPKGGGVYLTVSLEKVETQTQNSGSSSGYTTYYLPGQDSLSWDLNTVLSNYYYLGNAFYTAEYEPAELGRAESATPDGIAVLRFFQNGICDLSINTQVITGCYWFEDDALQISLNGMTVFPAENGSYRCVFYLSDESVIEFTLDSALTNQIIQ